MQKRPFAITGAVGAGGGWAGRWNEIARPVPYTVSRRWTSARITAFLSNFGLRSEIVKGKCDLVDDRMLADSRLSLGSFPSVVSMLMTCSKLVFETNSLTSRMPLMSVL